jgi:rhomboid family protein
MPRPTPVIWSLLSLNGLMFLAELSDPWQGHLAGLALWPLHLLGGGPSLFRPWQMVSYAFLHGGITHLLLNMYALWMFGTPLELRWGARRFAIFYFTCVVGAALAHLLVAQISLAHGGPDYPVIGASGGVFGLLLAFGLLYPDVTLILLFPPIPLKARWLVLGYGALELVTGVTGTAAGVAHFAHLGGMLTGYLLLRSGWR